MATKTACSVCGKGVGNERNAMHVSSAIHQAALIVAPATEAPSAPPIPAARPVVISLPPEFEGVLTPLGNGKLNEKQQSEQVAKGMRQRMFAYGCPNAEHPQSVVDYMNLAGVTVYWNRIRERGESGLRPGG